MHTIPLPQFPVATPESVGLSSAVLRDILSDFHTTDNDFHSMLVMRHGKLVFEHYFDPYHAEDPHSMYSVSKTIAAMCIGIAQGKGMLNINDRVVSFFPDVEIANPSPNLLAMTLRDLLIMATGQAVDAYAPMVASPDGDWVKAFLNLPVEYEPGTRFLYNTGATYMLSAVLTRLTGRPLIDLANEWIFDHIGVKGAYWKTCPKGISQGGTGLYLRPRDMLRFGQLLMADGAWEGKQLIPADFVQEAQQWHIDSRKSAGVPQHHQAARGYCYQMWRCSYNAFRADGMGGQYIVMVPEKDLIVVITSSLLVAGYALDTIGDKILTALSDDPLPENPAAAADLAALSGRLHKLPRAARPEAADTYPAGTRFEFGESQLGLTALTLRKDGVICQFGQRQVTLYWAWEAPYVNPPVPGGLFWRCETLVTLLARADADALYMRLNCVNECQTLHIRISRGDNGIFHCRIHSNRFGVLEADA